MKAMIVDRRRPGHDAERRGNRKRSGGIGASPAEPAAAPGLRSGRISRVASPSWLSLSPGPALGKAKPWKITSVNSDRGLEGASERAVTEPLRGRQITPPGQSA
jgi:hypothetical protein